MSKILKQNYAGWQMNKLIVALLGCVSLQAHASLCESFKISVKNDTPSTCYLTQRTLKSGVIYKRQPYKIKSGATITQFELTDAFKHGSSIEFTYECSDTSSISLLSSKEGCTVSGAQIEGAVVKAIGLNAVFTKIDGSYFSQKPGSINWTIS